MGRRESESFLASDKRAATVKPRFVANPGTGDGSGVLQTIVAILTGQ